MHTLTKKIAESSPSSNGGEFRLSAATRNDGSNFVAIGGRTLAAASEAELELELVLGPDPDPEPKRFRIMRCLELPLILARAVFIL